MRYRWIIALFLLAATAILLRPYSADATTVKQYSVEQMAQSASLVVEGTVQGKISRWDESGQYIITEVSVSVTQTLKGKVAGPVTVRVLGGEVGQTGMYVAGSPQFVMGEEVLLLLEPHPKSDWRIVGFHQGKFNISRNSKTGEKSVYGPAMSAAMPLSDLESLIRANAQGK